MSGTRRNYNVHGLALTIDCRAAAVIEQIDLLLGVFACCDTPADAFCLDIRSASPDQWPHEEPSLTLRWRGELADGLAVSYYVGPQKRRITTDGCALCDVDLAAWRGQLYVSPGAETTFRHSCLAPALSELLAARGHYVIHAGCLAVDNPERSAGILLSGQSGAGKTTTTLALARAGLTLLADDATFLRCIEGNQLRVWGLRQPFKVHTKTLELLPWLLAAPRRPASTPGEFLVKIDSWFPPAANEVPPGVIVFLQDRNGREHRIEPVSPLAAIERLAGENVRAAEPIGQGPAGEAFRAISRLAATCPAFALSVGPELSTLRERLNDLLPADRGG